MKFIVTYTAKRKNARRHMHTEFGKRKYFNTIEEAEKVAKGYAKRCNAAICKPNFEIVKEY
jgi:hypothetical protein